MAQAARKAKGRPVWLAPKTYQALKARQEAIRKDRGRFVSMGSVVAELLEGTAPKGRGRAG